MDTKIWTEESDNYTKRAIDLHDNDLYSSEDKIDFASNVINNITKYIKQPQNILDIGCAFGASINALKDSFTQANFFGIDPGKESVQIANKNLTNERISFTNGFSHDLPYEDNKFDVIIFSMVLQWIPRKNLIQTIAEVDRVLKSGG